MDFDGNTAYAMYSAFMVGLSSDNNKVTVSGYSCSSGDSMRPENGGKFHTIDTGNGCVDMYKGA